MNSINFYTPIDAIYDNGKLFIMNENNTGIDNKVIQIEPAITFNLDIDEDLLNDTQGPIIEIYHNDVLIINNSTIYEPYDLRINFSDELPINLSGYNFHYLKLWIDNNQSNSIILNTYPFNATSETSGYIDITLNNSMLNSSQHNLNIEGWDILNNYSMVSYNVNIDNLNKDPIFNIYNFPNPFKERTFFTFQMKNPESITINVKILSKSGKKLITLSEEVNDSKNYHVFPEIGWDGTDKYNNKLKNGTYFYHLYITNENGSVLHSKIHNITILN